MRIRPQHRRVGLTTGLLALGLASALVPSAQAQTPPAYQVTQNFSGQFTLGVNDGFIPPDTMGAVGPTQFGELINGGYAVFSKTGGLVSQTTDQSFWNAAGLTTAAQPGVFDPRIQYDSSSGHWFATELAFSSGNINNQLLVAVSKTSDLTQGFNGFAFNTFSGTSQNYFADFDTLGVNAQGVYVGLNDFGSNNAFATSVLAIDKASLIGSPTSAAPTSTLFYNQNPNSTGATPHPVTDMGTDTTAYLLSDYNTPAGRNSLSTITGTTGQLNGGGGNVAVTAYNAPPNDTQKGSTALIDGGDTRFSGSVVKVGTIIYGAQSVMDPGAGGLEDIRIVGIDATTKATVLDQLIGNGSLNYNYPSLAINSAGKVVVGFSSSGPDQYASSDVLVGQLNTAGTLITFGGPTTTAAGQGSYNVTFGGTANRWGDYSSTTLDPTDPNNFWTIQEYASATNQWTTNISEVSISSPGAAPEPSQLAGLGFTAFGALGLILRARRRKAAAPSA